MQCECSQQGTYNWHSKQMVQHLTHFVLQLEKRNTLALFGEVQSLSHHAAPASSRGEQDPPKLQEQERRRYTEGRVGSDKVQREEERYKQNDHEIALSLPDRYVAYFCQQMRSIRC